MLRWSVCISLIVSVSSVGSALAQELHPLQAKLGGQWTVGSSSDDSEPIALQQFLALGETNLTAAGEGFRARYRSEADDPVASCPMAGSLAGQPVDFEIRDRGEIIDIVAFGRTRHVYMDYELNPPQAFIPNELGWSVGRWAGDMLVIRTTGFSEGAISSGERPLPFGGPIAQIVERYTLSQDQNRLSVKINLNDPKYYLFSLRVRHDYVRADNILPGRDCAPALGVGEFADPPTRE